MNVPALYRASESGTSLGFAFSAAKCQSRSIDAVRQHKVGVGQSLQGYYVLRANNRVWEESENGY